MVRSFRDKVPQLAEGVFLAEGCAVVGDVVLGEDTNVWYGVVIRGDVGKVRIGKRANLQDLVCVHMTTEVSDAVIGDDVSIGHGAIIHGAIIEEGALVGMGCILMDNARIGRGAIVGAGSLVTTGTQIPPKTLALGRPAKVIRELSADEARAGVETARKYVGLARAHAESGRVE